jgi:hypothetical protein
MLRLLNFSFNGDIHWVFFITNIKVGNRIHRFCLPMPYRFRKYNVLSFCPFSFDHCVVYHSSIYGFCLPFGIFLISRFMCILLWIIVRPFVFFLSATMFSVFLPFTASDYPFTNIKIEENVFITLQLLYSVD